MNLLYINYWSLGNFLTIATVFPNLEILKQYFSTIHLTTVERESTENTYVPAGVTHIPFYSATRLPRFLCKLYDFFFYLMTLSLFTKRTKPDLIICRGSMAGIFGFFLNLIFKVPFMVESFEPHAEYMVDGGTWKRGSPEYRFQSWIEKQIEKYAMSLMPVTFSHKNKLIERGISADKIFVMPCCADLEKFKFNGNARIRMREQLKLTNSTVVGIYVGKFGGLYLEEDAFRIFKRINDSFQGFFLIILTSDSKDWIEGLLKKEGFPGKNYFVGRVPHQIVPDYLAASDFGFSLVRTSPSSRFCSPVKNGEYWANGLSIMLPKGVGDDELIIEETGSGVVFDPNNLSLGINRLHELLKEDRLKLVERNSRVAFQYRDFSIIRNAYKELLTKYGFNE
jgi:glycosyltransferase involved in cell wall biosynthesis